MVVDVGERVVVGRRVVATGVGISKGVPEGIDGIEVETANVPWQAASMERNNNEHIMRRIRSLFS